ncbi:SIS domain-containing protein [Enterocloster citroniae]|uniref:SIS domain-containing protein n=1 Tax=Enterocloster citroniae TaxID=358743 RepID=UPI003071C064|nr:SIS domain-containing protein [Enterocloster citroniae]
MEWTDKITDYIGKEVTLLNEVNRCAIEATINAVLEAYEAESAIYVFGNGGSASTASHMANDFNKGISEYTEKKFRICCLNDNVATLMSIANDISYEEVFSFQLKNKMKPGDIAIGISGSGNSENVIRALKYAKSVGMKTIGWVGFDGGAISQIADIVFHVPIHDMQIVEDIHLILNHLIMSVIMQNCGLKGHC